jgi:hypothetical protein
MARRLAPQATHADDIETAVAHFNEVFRFRYRLPSTTSKALGGEEAWREAAGDFEALRANGVADASCAAIASFVVSQTPRYAIGIVLGNGQIAVQYPDDVDEAAYRGNSVILVNPLGGADNWKAVTRWFKHTAADAVRRRELAGLASERRPDEEAVSETLADAAEDHGRAVVLPPDEGFSSERAAEVAFIFDVEPETLRSWKQRERRGRSSGKAGRPRKKPVG